MRSTWILFAAMAAMMTMPTVGAQNAQAVNECARECDPRAMNGGAHKTGTEPVDVIIYGHFEDILQRAPLNAQPPDPDREPDWNRGFMMPTIDTNTIPCLPPNICGDLHFRNNWFELFSSPGLVEFMADGSWRTHQEPGLAGDAKVVGDEIRLYWYLSAHAVPNANSNEGLGRTTAFGAVPQVGIYARMETGRFPFHGEILAESVDYDGNPVATGQRVNVVSAPGQPEVYEFQVTMKVAKHVIPSSTQAEGFTVLVNPYQIKTDPQKGNQFEQAEWRLRTGPKFPARLVIPMEEPMKTVAASLSNFENRLFVRWSLLSVLGSYDMRDAALRLDSTGPNPIPEKAIDLIILKRGIDHDAHFKPVNATWAIDFVNVALADGDYEITASIPNMQDTYLLAYKFGFKVVDGRPQVHEIGGGSARAQGASGDGARKDGNTPGFEAAAMVGVLAVAYAIRRRA